MYGIVNKAIHELVIAKLGEDKWESIKANSGIDVDYFISNEPYDDDITYALAGSVSREMGITVPEVLCAFGEWWILVTSKKNYGALLTSGGDSLRSFLINLPEFHTRVMLMYPKLTPPEFKVSDIGENSLALHYYSKREGLQGFVKGLLQGLSKLYDTATQIEMVESRLEGHDHDVFKVSWEK